MKLCYLYIIEIFFYAKLIINALQDTKIYEHNSGRVMPGASNYSRNSEFDFKVKPSISVIIFKIQPNLN